MFQTIQPEVASKTFIIANGDALRAEEINALAWREDTIQKGSVDVVLRKLVAAGRSKSEGAAD